VIQVANEDALATARNMATVEGLLVGISAGGNVSAAVKLGEQLHAEGREAVIVTVLCDGADKYLSEHFWEEAE
jgi:cysteine synthase B